MLRSTLKLESRFKDRNISMEGDLGVCKALVNRGFAVRINGKFYLTDEGRERATLPADKYVERDGVKFDKSLLEHWRPEES
jgi:hypothetical protein